MGGHKERARLRAGETVLVNGAAGRLQGKILNR